MTLLQDGVAGGVACEGEQGGAVQAEPQRGGGMVASLDRCRWAVPSGFSKAIEVGVEDFVVEFG